MPTSSGLRKQFGVDHKRNRNAASPARRRRFVVVLAAERTSSEGLLAPPCGSASRARQIPLKRKRLVILREGAMDLSHCEMMHILMDYLVYLIQINKGFLWQIIFTF